jgi:Glycosyl transferase family 2
MPFASVLVDTFNHEAFIEKAVTSVLEQDFPLADREIIVVDDGSTDRTPEILRKFLPHIRIMRKPNGGQASAFNVGIPECRGEIISFLDGDDWWAQGKLRRVAALMSRDSSLGMIGHAIIESFNDGLERVIAPGAERRFRLDSFSSADLFRMHRCFLGTSRLTLRAPVARKILPVPDSLTIEADEFLFTLAAAHGESIILTEPLTHYRIHGANLFMAPGASSGGERRKARSLAALASELRRALPAAGAPPDAVAAVLEIVEAEAAQLRLALEGGFPWETFRAETALYRIQHRDALWTSRVFRALSMVPALVLPPRWFYAGRRWLGAQSWYKRARRDLLPVPQMSKSGEPRNEG